nr:neuropeptide [Hymenolepis microstoma]
MNSSRLLVIIAIAVALLALVYQPVQATRINPEEDGGLDEMYALDDLEGPFFVDRRGFLTSSRLGRRKKGFLTAGRLGR